MDFRELVSDAFAHLHRQTTYEGIANWLEENSHILAINLQLNQRKRSIIPFSFNIRKVRFERVIWRPDIPNNKRAPIGKPTNFMGLSHLPKGYPGWVGNLYFLCDREFTIDELVSTLSHTGIHLSTPVKSRTSWGFNEPIEYGVVLFGEDFPMMAMLQKLTGDEFSKINEA